MISTSDELLAGGPTDVRIGIGRGTDRGLVEASVEGSGADVRIYDDPWELVSDMVDGRIDAAVRGDMPSDVLVPILRKELGLERLERAALMEPSGGRMFLLAPVGIDEGWTEDQRFDIARRSADLASRVGMDARIAVMSGGRSEDIGRCPEVDATILGAESVTERLIKAGYDAYNCQILVENAAKEVGVIVAPDGICGNLIFRTMHFIGGARSLGAPLLNTDKVFVDTSRAKTDYRDSIALAGRLTEEAI